MCRKAYLLLSFILCSLLLCGQHKNKIGVGLINSTMITEFTVLGDCNNPILSTYANQLSYERTFKDSISVYFDIMYFTDEINKPQEGFINKNDFEGFQFELGLQRKLYSVRKLSGDFGLGVFIATPTGEQEGLKYYGAKIIHKFEYELNPLFGVFLRSSVNYFKLNFSSNKESQIKPMIVDSFGFNIYF